MTTVKKTTAAPTPAKTTPTTTGALKPRTLRVAERAEVAAALSKLLGKPVDAKGVTGRLGADGRAAFSYRAPTGRADDLYGMLKLEKGAYSATEVRSGDPALLGKPTLLYPKPATGFSAATTGAPAVVTNPTGTPVTVSAPTPAALPVMQPVTLPPLTLPALSGDARAQAAQYLDVVFRAESREKYAGVYASWANENRSKLTTSQADYERQRARADMAKRYEPYNFLSYDMTAKATGERVDHLKTALGENLQKSAQSAAEGKQLRDALQAWTTQGEAVVTQLMKDDPAAFLKLRHDLMLQNGLTPPPMPAGFTGPDGAPLTLSPNGNQYGANAQGHGNLLAADPSGSRWSYVNPTPVVNQTNPWTDTGRLP